MYTIKYRPSNLTDFVGNNNVVQSFEKWLLSWSSANKKQKCALISGSTGIGKTLLAELILNNNNFNINELNLDCDRNKDYIKKNVKPILTTKRTYLGKQNVLLVSDIDCGNDNGFISSLIECIKETEIPIVCICDNRYDQSIKSVTPYCVDFKMGKPTYEEVYRLIYKVVITEKIKIGESRVKKLYAESNGDIRYILNTLQMNLKKNDGTKDVSNPNVFDTTKRLLSMDTDIDSKYNMYWLNNDIHTLMIQENYINNTFKTNCDADRLENIAKSSDSLSDADLFETRVNVTNWEIGPYVALMTVKSTQKCNAKTKINFPQFLGKTSTINKNKREKMNYETVKLKVK
jgi:replication factor C subunit 1